MVLIYWLTDWILLWKLARDVRRAERIIRSMCDCEDCTFDRSVTPDRPRDRYMARVRREINELTAVPRG